MEFFISNDIFKHGVINELKGFYLISERKSFVVWSKLIVKHGFLIQSDYKAIRTYLTKEDLTRAMMDRVFCLTKVYQLRDKSTSAIQLLPKGVFHSDHSVFTLNKL